jgi:antibiotic biosynthesis monooxygenase (ABM) superfamily enzyme
MKPKFKLIAALKIWLVIYPSITLFLLAFGNQLSGLALYQRTFILTITLVPWMVFIGVPVVDSIFKMISSKKRTQDSTTR